MKYQPFINYFAEMQFMLTTGTRGLFLFMKNINLVGKKFFRLTIVSQYMKFINEKKRRLYCDCLCDCGKNVTRSAYLIASRNNVSCGCYIKENPARFVHGATKKGKNDREYHIYSNMIQRCFNKKTERYKDYGARGITVCNNWLGVNGYSNFILDMGKCNDKSLSLDRIDNNKGYSKENCRWADNKTQSRNTRRNRVFEYNGVSKIATDWAIELNILPSYINKHMGRGKTFEQTYLYFKNKTINKCKN